MLWGSIVWIMLHYYYLDVQSFAIAWNKSYPFRFVHFRCPILGIYLSNITKILELAFLHYIINLLSFIGLYKNCINRVMVIWMILVRIQYLKYSNRWDIVFEWHMWMFMFKHKNRIILCKITLQQLHGFS